jgi:sulfur relay (sulfurtransferase) complex TusBCD TusD component (DsrE family)
LREEGPEGPQGYYNTDLMLRSVGRHGAEIDVCATCMTPAGLPTRSSQTPRTEARSRSLPIECSGPIAHSCSSEGRRTRG